MAKNKHEVKIPTDEYMLTSNGRQNCTLFQISILQIDRFMTFLDFKWFGAADAKISD